MKHVKLKWLVSTSNAGEVIDKSYWGDGEESLYTCARDIMRSDFSDFPNWKRTTTDDLLLTRNGTPYIHIPVEGAIYSNVVQRISVPKVDKYYLRYALEDRVRSFRGYGVSIESLNYEMWSNLEVPLPDLATQRQIADFLDRETARIDLLIEKKQRLVALLGEKLEDDILRAVTLGIDPRTELVPEDELEWTSHRPRHWKLLRLKHFFRENTQYSTDGKETLFSLRMKEGLVPHKDVSDKEIPPSDLINYKKILSGQIVMNRMRAAIGLFGLADRAGVVSPDYSIFDVSPTAHAAYFLRLFKTEPMMAAFRLLSKGLGTGHSGFMRLNADNFGRIRVAVPDGEEQRLISEYVEERIGQISRLQNKNSQSIDRLKEYRSALITAAVTGQIDVTTYAKSGTPDRRLDAIQEEMGANEIVVSFEDESVSSLLSDMNHADMLESKPGKPKSDYIEFLVARFNGIKIEIFANEHPPPHFRVKTNAGTGNFGIDSCEPLHGAQTVLRRHREIKRWHTQNRQALIQKWNETRPSDCTVGKFRDGSSA